MNNLSIKELNMETWKDFERLVQKHNGVWEGCWCRYFHPTPPEKIESKEASKSYKLSLVKEDRSHAALVYDGDTCVACCQFGPPEELPNIIHKKEVESKMTLPDWRITCIFVDRDYRKNGLSFIALNAALELIKNAGGGIVESYPQRILKEKKYQIRSYIMEQRKSLKTLVLIIRVKKGKIIVL